MSSVEHGDDVSHSQRHSDKQKPYQSPPSSPGFGPSYDIPEVSDEPHTSLHGQPIPDHADRHDNYTNMMLGDGGGLGSALGGYHTGANYLPPGYTDKSIVRIPIRESDLGPPDEEEEYEPGGQTYDPSDPSPEFQSTKRKWFQSLKAKATNPIGSSSKKHKDRISGFKIVMMTRGDYLRYWAKGEDGNFLPSVQEPPEGRRQWVKRQMELNEEWIRDDPSLAEGGNYGNVGSEKQWAKKPGAKSNAFTNMTGPELGYGQPGSA